jgi:hypothetical protein
MILMSIRRAKCVIALVRVWCWINYPRQTIPIKLKISRWPDPAYPKQRNDKYAGKKAFNRNPLFTEVSDKLSAKAYAMSRHPQIKVAGTLWVGKDVRHIPKQILIGNVVVKASRGSGFKFRRYFTSSRLLVLDVA